jgi:hypothetical protein
MSIKVGEVGKLFSYGTFFDLSGSTALDLKFTAPDGTVTTISNPRVTAPAVEMVATIEASDGTETQVTFPVSTYMQFSALAGDFPQAGSWTVCGTYTDATPKIFFGDPATFTVEAAC